MGFCVKLNTNIRFMEEKEMKKVLSLVLSVALVSALFVGCGEKELKQVSIHSVEDLNGLNVGAQTATTGEAWIQSNTTAKVTGYKSGMDAAMQLKNGAMDAVILDELPAKEIVKKNPTLRILELDFAEEEYAIAVKKGNTELLESINKTIADMQANGEYEELMNAFMPADGGIKIPESIIIDSDKELKLGTNAAFHPFEYLEGTKIVGFDISMGEKIAKDYNAKLVVNNMEFESLIPALSSGTIDFIAAGMSVTEDKKKNVDFSIPYYSSKQVIIVRK